MQYDGKIGDAFTEWLLGDRSAATGLKIEQAAKTRFALNHNELFKPINEVGIEDILKRAGIEEKKATDIHEGLLGDYISILIDEHSMKAFEDGFQLAVHLLTA